MTTVVALAARLAVLLVTAGVIVATCNAPPLFELLVVTTAVRLPAVLGLVENVTVIEVVVAAVTVPTALLLKTTVLRLAVGSKPRPLMVTVAALAARFAVLLVTTGVTVPTWTAAPLIRLLVVTTAVRLPAILGFVENVTVSDVAVAAVTVPIAPLLKTTVLFAGVVSKPKPLMVIVFALAARLVVSLVTTGVTLATCTAKPLLKLLVVTAAVKDPAAAGLVENVTVSDVVEAEVTVPTALLLKMTVLLPAVGSNPKPLIVTVFALAARLAVLLVTTGVTLATWTAEPLLTLFVVTTAVKLPAVAGFVENVTESAVGVAAVTVPTAPLLKTTVLRDAIASKPKPLIVSVEDVAARLAVLVVTTGVTVAT
jgi:hypothetical protein